MKTKLIQILYDMRTQPIIAWVTVIGTALSIFLIMVVMIMQQVSLLPLKPELNRDRMLYGRYLHIQNISEENNNSSGSFAYSVGKKLYGDLEGVEEISFMGDEFETVDVKGSTNEKFSADLRRADDGFWRVFDYDLLAGRFFNADEVDAERKVAIVTQSTARRLFGSENPVGGHFELDHNAYEVVGIVSDASKLATEAYGQVFAPISHKAQWSDFFGRIQVALLVKEGVDFNDIRSQVKGRYAMFNTELEAQDQKTIYHGSPFDQKTIAGGGGGSNTTPDTSGEDALRIFIYVLLLVVPAINLSSMLHSRLRRRVSEIGVRRAFGCTKARIVTDIIVENLIVTVAGGIIGLLLGMAFTQFYDGLFSYVGNGLHPSMSLLFHWKILAFAFGACFVLNIISASVPAWQAARTNPVDAINAK